MRKPKKLLLNRTTVRALTDKALAVVIAGGPNGPADDTYNMPGCHPN